MPFLRRTSSFWLSDCYLSKRGMLDSEMSVLSMLPMRMIIHMKEGQKMQILVTKQLEFTSLIWLHGLNDY